MQTNLTFLVLLTALFLCLLFLFCGCMNPTPAGNSHVGSPAAFGPEWLDAMIEVAKGFAIANAASTAVNPYAFPIRVGLAGVITTLEALIRKEKSGRKQAEHELNVNGNNKKNPV